MREDRRPVVWYHRIILAPFQVWKLASLGSLELGLVLFHLLKLDTFKLYVKYLIAQWRKVIAWRQKCTFVGDECCFGRFSCKNVEKTINPWY